MGIMDSITLLAAVGMVSMTGLVGVAVYLANARAVERMTQESLNYRAELRAGASSPGPGQGEEGPGDLLSTIMAIAQNNPQLVQAFVSQLKGSQDQGPGNLPPQ